MVGHFTQNGLANVQFLFFRTNASKYSRSNVPLRHSGGVLLVLFPDQLDEFFWLKRSIELSHKPEHRIRYPVFAFDSLDKSIIINNDLPDSALLERIILKSSQPNSQAVSIEGLQIRFTDIAHGSRNIRLASFKDMSNTIKRHSWIKKSALFIIILFLIIMFPLTTFFTSNFRYSLKTNVSIVFILAMSLPLVNLVTTGNTYIKNEKNRLIDLAYSQMSNALNALELRYEDTPSLLQQELLNSIDVIIGDHDLSIEEFDKKMSVVLEQELFTDYQLIDSTGKMLVDTWKRDRPASKLIIQNAALKILQDHRSESFSQPVSIVQATLDEEINDFFAVAGFAAHFTNPDQMVRIVFSNDSLFIMLRVVSVNQEQMALILRMPEYIIEEQFAKKEFASNLAAVNQNLSHTSLTPELVFYSRYDQVEHLPSETNLWQKLKPEFERAFFIAAEEKGTVELADKKYLYYLRPVSSMNYGTMIPCFLIPLENIERQLFDNRFTIALISFVTILITIIMSLIFSSELLFPVKLIDKAAIEVAENNLNSFLPQMGTDEIGNLALDFNKMLSGVRQHQKMKAYISDSVLESIRNSAIIKSHASRAITGSVMFADVRNFTYLSETHEASEIFKYLNQLMSTIENIVRKHGGRVEKYIGDAMTAVFVNKTINDEKCTLSCVEAAFYIQKFVNSLELDRRQKGLFAASMGIGISTGELLIGEVGSSKRKDLTTIGFNTELAETLETVSKNGIFSKIILSEQTYLLVKESVNAKKMPAEIQKRIQHNAYELISINNDDKCQ